MSSVEERQKPRVMPVGVRPLEARDLAQSAEIERDSFPFLFPTTSFRRELNNRRARYLVAWKRTDNPEGEADLPELPIPGANGTAKPLIGKLLQSARSIWTRPSAWRPGQQFLTGFVGIWYVTGEAHIVSVGVRPDHRGHGIGELLLISAFEQVMATRADVVTLEVRKSNHVAINLYNKYGFKERGLRKGYYTDNGEDAVIMTTDSIRLPDFPGRFRELVRAHERRWGSAERVVS